jgi:hypothetical protein
MFFGWLADNDGEHRIILEGIILFLFFKRFSPAGIESATERPFPFALSQSRTFFSFNSFQRTGGLTLFCVPRYCNGPNQAEALFENIF